MQNQPILNPDNFKYLLTENTPVKLANDQVHEEGSIIADRALKHLVEDRRIKSFIIDKRFGDLKSVANATKEATASGRKLDMYDVDASLEHSAIGVLMRKPGGAGPDCTVPRDR